MNNDQLPQQPQTPEAIQPLSATDASPAHANADQSQELAVPATKSKAVGYGIAAAVLVLVLGGAGAWWFTSHKQAPKKAATAADTKKDIPLIRYAALDPHTDLYPPALATAGISSLINHQLYETLVTYENGNKIVPLLARSWSNSDENTWVFKLLPNVKFHNGRTMDSADVKGSIEASQKEQGYELFTASIKSIDIIDALTIKITTKQPDAVLLNKLSFIFIYDTKSAKKGDPELGSGPYVVKPGTVTSSEKIDLIASDDYHGGHVYTREVVIQTISKSEDQAKAFLAGEIEIANTLTSDDIATILQSKPSTTIVTYPIGSVYSLLLNTTKGPFTNFKLRQALMLSIDPQKLIDTAKVAAVLANQAVPVSVPGYNPEIKRPALDRVKAKQLVVEAGYPKGVTISVIYVASQVSVIDEIAAELAPIGITLKRTINDGTTYFIKIQNGAADVALSSYASDINDASDVISAELQSGNVYSLYKNPKVDELLTEANRTFDPAKRLALLQQILKIGADDIFQIPIRTKTGKSVLNKPYVVSQDLPGTPALGLFFWKAYQK